MNSQPGTGEPSKYRILEFHVDPAWYQQKYPQAALAVQAGTYRNLAEYHAVQGDRELKSPSSLFAASYYARRSGYLSHARDWGTVEDYLRRGADLGISPHWLFSEEFFLSQSTAVRSAVQQGTLTGSYVYYLRVGNKKGFRPHPLFNPVWLIKSLPGLAPEGLFKEFLNFKHIEGLSPSPLFDPQWYAGRYRDLRDNVGPGLPLESLLQHFCEFGLDEGRVPLPDLDVDFYLRECLKINALENVKGFNAVQHFLNFGVKAGINPNRFFQSAYYLERNPQVAQEIKEQGFLGPFEHFLAVGLQRNYKAAPPLVHMAVDDDAAKSLFEKRARMAADRLLRGEKLQLESPVQPLISAIVPVYNNFNYTAWLLQQLRSYQLSSPGLKLEVIVVDNGSTDLTRKLAALTAGVKLVHLDKPVGYPTACNAGAKAASGEFLVFLNNDVELIDGSFEAVAKTLADSTVGAVASRVIKLNGILQEAGGLVWRDGSAAGYGRGADPLSARFMVARDVDYGSGCFLGVKRRLFETLGGFEEQFSPGYYEETDLCARIWESGQRVRYEPDAAIHHYEYASFSKGRPETISTALMARNQALFVQRNRRFLAGLPAADFSRIDSLAFRRGARRKHAVFVEDFVPSEAIGSGFGRARDTVDNLLAQGWWVTLWILHKREGIEGFDQGLCETIFQPDYPGGMPAYLKSAGDTVDLVWLCRTHNFKRFGPMLDAWRAGHPEARLVFDTEAVASVRPWLASRLAEGEKVALSDLPSLLPSSLVKQELAGAQYADTLIVVNDIDRALIATAFDVETRVLGLRFDAAETPALFEQREHLLFVGAVHEVGSPNYDSLVWFCNKVMPLLRKKIPQCRLRIVGYWKPGIAMPEALLADDVDIVGAVDELQPCFEHARVFIAPTRVAAGVPHKVGQAMALGVPAVVTPILAAQLRHMGGSGTSPFFEALDFSAVAFADAVSKAYTDKAAWNNVRAAASIAVRTHCSPESFANVVREVVSERECAGAINE
jgi:GT2 family glycosyltransferase